MTQFLLGIDIGTGSTKGVLTTLDGDVVDTVVRDHGMSMPYPGWAEVDAVGVWWDDIVVVARQLMQRVGTGRVESMCVSGVGPCLLVCDDELRPLRPAILYGIDGRAEREIEELTTQLGQDQILARCGKSLSTQAVGPKMRWLARHEPQVWKQARRWFNSSSYAVARLTGEYVLDHHTASQSDPLYDVRQNRWIGDWVPEVAAHLQMPRLAYPHEVVGTVSESAARATGVPTGTPVAAGTVDAWAEAFSAGVRHPGDLMLMYGSTMFFVQVLGRYRTHPKLWTTVGVEAGQHTIAAGMSTSGSLTSWVQQLTGGPSFEQLVVEAAEVPVGSEGLVMLPYFAGERTPVFDPKARGVLAGLTLQHTRGHLFRATYEGIAFGIRQIIEFLDQEDDPIERLVAVGGGTKGGLWTQIVSDVTGRPQQVPTQTIGASYGDALLAGIGVGLLPPQTDWSFIGSIVEPRARHRKVYDELFDVYRTLYPATRDLVHRLGRSTVVNED